jgi:hypothetical protein
MKRLVVTTSSSGIAEQPVAVSLVFEDADEVQHVSHFVASEPGWKALGSLLLDGMTRWPSDTTSKIQELEFFAGKPDLLRKVTYTDSSP